jgi:hypothetical protein
MTSEQKRKGKTLLRLPLLEATGYLASSKTPN